ncbi:MAG: CoA transferase [Coxiellaceae bacterium]|nr:CoA transferase [Coxiellaceae bacterium]
MSKAPLKGITVLDLTRAVSGPYCTMLLSNLGATIIKIERPGSGDDTRSSAPFKDDVSTYNAVFNHDKKSIALDLKNANDRKILDELLPKADVLVENFRPGVMEKLGLGWDTLHQQHPELIYAAISGYGLTGPIAQHACYDLIAQGLSGLMSLTGHPEEKPTKVGTEISDIVTGIFASYGINTALYHRAMTGEGSLVDVAMLDSTLSLLYSAVNRYTASGDIPTAIGNRHPMAVPFDTYPTKDRPFNIAVANDSLFVKLCDALEQPELAQDNRFNSIAGRAQNREALDDILIDILQHKTAKEWLARCVDAGVPAGRIYDMHEVLEFPQLKHRNMVAEFKDGYLPGIKFPGTPIKISCLDDTNTFGPAPTLDGNRDEILRFIKTGKW